MHPAIEKVTNRIIERSKPHRNAYLQRIEENRTDGLFRDRLECSNLAHDLAACNQGCRNALMADDVPNIAIITAYNDMVSAHEPYGAYPDVLKKAAAEAGATAQVAGGVPAMCDGITQGEPGMDLSLISRDVIAMSTVIALSHNVFEGAMLLGICDKILPGLLLGALQFGYLPMILVPGGPMTSGIEHSEKNKARALFAQGKISRKEMLEVEVKAYHSPGTCTFYGTANSNQLMAEMLGMHLPGASFVNAGTDMRRALTEAAAHRIAAITHLGEEYTPIGHVISEKSVVNAMVGLMASGGSTNETIHLVAIARAAGIRIDWSDFEEISDNVPLLVRIYPNGSGDINTFQQAGGMALLIRELMDSGMLHEDVLTVAGHGFGRYTQQPVLDDDRVVWKDGPEKSMDSGTIATVAEPFDAVGGTRILTGNIGRAVMKISALKDGENTYVEAPAMVFHSQKELEDAFHAGRLDRDVVAVVRFQGPRANGMPELHKLIMFLTIVMQRGFKAGLVTDGRLSGASGTVPFAIHCSPEAEAGGNIARIQDGDVIVMDAKNRRLSVKVDDTELEQRPCAKTDLSTSHFGLGRQIFAALRKEQLGADKGASAIFSYLP